MIGTNNTFGEHDRYEAEQRDWARVTTTLYRKVNGHQLSDDDVREILEGRWKDLFSHNGARCVDQASATFFFEEVSAKNPEYLFVVTFTDPKRVGAEASAWIKVFDGGALTYTLSMCAGGLPTLSELSHAVMNGLHGVATYHIRAALCGFSPYVR